jgi:hypothetical protein
MPQQDSNDRLATNPDELNGWKEIAKYVGRSERTVQRWERQYGFPVHRVPATKGEVVFALRSEIDRWKLSSPATESTADIAGLTETSPASETTTHLEVSPTSHVRGPRSLLIVCVSALIAAVSVFFAYTGMSRRTPVLSSDHPTTRPQGETYQFRGRGLTPAGIITRWTRVPNGSQEVMSSPLIADQDGSVQWGLTTDCRTETGTHVVWMVDEGTNTQTNAISLVVLRNPGCDKPAADLTPRDVTLDRASARPGEEITVTFSLWNIGTATAVPSTTRLRLGKQSTRTGPGDRALGDHATPAILVGASLQEHATVLIPPTTVPGIYYVWVVADNGNAILEHNSYNNFARSDAVAILPR